VDKNGLSSFLMGLGVGVAVGILFAPKSGEETRELIKNKAGEGTDYLKNRSSEFRQNASDWVDKGKEAVRSQRESFSDAMQAGKQAYKDAVSGQPSQPQPSGVQS
jgi:gas vesicle protein